MSWVRNGKRVGLFPMSRWILVCLPVCMSVYLSACSSVCVLSLCMSVCLSASMRLRDSMSLCFCVSVSLWWSLSVYPPTWPVFLCLSVWVTSLHNVSRCARSLRSRAPLRNPNWPPSVFVCVYVPAPVRLCMRLYVLVVVRLCVCVLQNFPQYGSTKERKLKNRSKFDSKFYQKVTLKWHQKRVQKKP